MNDKIYKLKLHESIDIPNGTMIIRVPGGWLYTLWNHEANQSLPPVFVPFNNEFQN